MVRDNTTNQAVPMNNKDYESLFNAFAINYLNIFLIYPNTGNCKILKLNGYKTTGFGNVNYVSNYEEMLSNYIKERVFDEDKAFLKMELSLDEVVRELESKDQFELPYRVIQDKQIHYYSAHYIKVNKPDEELLIVAGFRNIDLIISDEDKRKDEAMNKAYESLAKAFYSLHRVDIINNIYYEIKSSKYIKRGEIRGTNAYKENVDAVIDYVCTPEFHDLVKEFMDITTLEERLKHTNSVAIEFIGRFTGWVRMSYIVDDYDDYGHLYHVLLLVEVIDKERRREESLRVLAERDHLSGLYNRGTGEHKIKKFINQKVSGLFCLMDCDNFKSINDNFGHEIGDEVIRQIANVLKKNVHEEEISMRLGGDEFAIFLPNITREDEAKESWKKIVDGFKNIHIKELEGFTLSISAGCTLYDGGSEENFNTLYKKADDAMYISKKTFGYKLTFIK